METIGEGLEVLMIDPPWPKKKGGRRAVRPHQGRHLDYATMSVNSIFSLLDESILPNTAETHVIFLWVIDQFLLNADYEMESRGYKRHARLIWDKENGIAPCFTIRYSHEYLIWFYKPKLLPVSSCFRGKFTTVIRERSRQHSRKPDAAYSLVDSAYPTAVKMDIFSREKREGWIQWGNQCGFFNK